MSWSRHECNWEKTPWYLRLLGFQPERKLISNYNDNDYGCLFSFNYYSYWIYK